MLHPRLPLLLCAALALPCSDDARAALHCVGTAAALQAALDASENNGQSDDIRITRDVILLSGSASGFDFYPIDNFATTIRGGWESGCASRFPGTFSTLTGFASRPVLTVLNQASSGATSLVIDRLRFIDGLHGQNATAGLTVQSLNGGSADVSVLESQFIGNHSAGGGGGAIAISTQGTIKLHGLLVVDNEGGVGGVTLTCSGGTAYLTHNTFVANLSNNNIVPTGALWVANACPTYLQNNVFWNNQGPEVRTVASAQVHLSHNNLSGVLGATPLSETGTTWMNPQFRGIDDYRLAQDSPMVDSGVAAPLGGAPQRSLDGLPRLTGTTLDRGAYELDRLFGNSFE